MHDTRICTEKVPTVTEQTEDSARHSADRAARLLQRLWGEDPGSIARIAAHSRVPLADVESCRSGRARLSPEKQMRIAAATASIAPAHARDAHRLYAQAQAELRFALGLVSTHESYPGQGIAHSLARVEPARAVRIEDDCSVSGVAVARARELAETSQRLRDQSLRLAAESQRLSVACVEMVRRDVEGLARVLRESGAPPERALVLVKDAVAPLVAAVPEERDVVLDQIVRWFVASYYAA